MKKTIATYEIVREISQGAITNVYYAFQTTLSRPVTLKVLHANLATEQDIVARFQREARACARIKHENIVDIYDYGVDENSHFIAMEYVEGATLKALIDKKIRLPLDIFLFLAHEILSGLIYAHDHKIFHRDIKPGNILISNDGKVKIADFGLALMADLQTITVQNAILGTPAYMSPEQISGDKLDHRTDIFSLGATFYELLSGKQPFAGKNYSEILNNVINKQPEKLQRLVAEEFRPVANIIYKMLAKKKSQRYQNCGKIREEISCLAKKNSIDLKRVSLGRVADFPGKYALEKQGSETEKPAAHSAGSKIIVPGVVLVMLFLSFIYVQLSRTKSQNSLRQTTAPDSTKTATNALFSAAIYPPSDTLRSPVKSTTKAKKAKSLVPETKTEKHVEKQDVPVAGLQNGWLFIKCLPWAKIVVDGQSAATLSEADSLLIPLRAAEHKILWINSEFAPLDSVRKIVTIQANDTTRFIESFSRLAQIGFVSAEVIPWGVLYLDQKKIGATPLDPFPIKQGKHEIEIRHPEFGSWKRTFFIRVGEQRKFTVNLWQFAKKK